MTARLPKEERYSLTDQIRRSSRSVYANLAECSARRDYPVSYQHRLAICLGEAFETESWLDTCLTTGYLDAASHEKYVRANKSICKLIVYMRNHPEKFLSARGTKQLNRPRIR